MKRHEYAAFADRHIREYQQAVREAITLLRANYDCNQGILLAINSDKTMPSNGPLPDGSRYHRHGVGIRIERDEVEVVDFDFGPDEDVIGFDEWRVESFFRIRDCDDWSTFASKLKTGFAWLEQDGLIINPRALPSAHLYYFVDEWQSVGPA